MSADQVVAGRYRLTERLGGGSMGVVWQAHDERLRRTVAVKEVILPPGLDEARLEEIRRRTMREGRIAAKLHHPQLITVYDVIEDGGRPYLIMEYLPSTSLAHVLADRGPIPPDEVARVGAQAAAALAAAHAAGVVHGDVKPANILVGYNDTVKITDFGVSRVVEDVTGTVTGTFVGTPAYLAPEVAQGKDVTFAADVYALGATLYTAVEGTPPAGASDNPMALLHRIASGAVTPPTHAGPLTDLLVRLLSTDPAARPTMRDAERALDEIAGGWAGAPAAAPALAAPKRNRAVAVLAAIVVALLTVTTIVLLATRNDPPAGDRAGAPETSAGDAPAALPQQPPATDESTTEPPPAGPPPGARPPADPAAAVTSYYALMPGDPDEGFTRLTARFQRSPAGGPAGYRNFWRTIDAVRAAKVSAQGPTVEVTVDYSFKDGREVRERHRYGLVQQGGRWLIDTVKVLSSKNL